MYGQFLMDKTEDLTSGLNCPRIAFCMLPLERLHPRPERSSGIQWAPTFSFVHESMEREIFGRMKGRKDGEDRVARLGERQCGVNIIRRGEHGSTLLGTNFS